MEVQRNSPTVALSTIRAHLNALQAYLSASQRLDELVSIERLIEQQLQSRPADTRVPVEDVARNLDLVAQWLNEPYLGLRLAPYSSRHHPHLSFFFSRSEFPLKEYLQILQRYISLCTEVMTLTLEETDTTLSMVFTPVEFVKVSVHQQEGFAASVADAVYRSFGLRPSHVSFCHQRGLNNDEEIAAFQRIFGVEPQFRQPTIRLTFTAQASGKTRYVSGSNSNLQKLEALNHKAFPNESWADRCRFLLRLLMYCGEPQKQTLADILSVTPRTLQRRLEEEGTSFREVLNTLRKVMADGYIREDKLSHEEITFLLGFQDRGVFYRAFRQWFDCTPREYRDRHR